jgi:hypothetical protein
MEYHYDNLLERLNLLTLYKRRRHFDTLFLINVFIGTKCCPYVLEIVGLRVHTRNIRNFNMFTCSSSHCPSARRVSTSGTVNIRNSCFCLKGLNWIIFVFLFFVLFVLCCSVAGVICIRADSVIGHWLLSSARK